MKKLVQQEDKLTNIDKPQPKLHGIKKTTSKIYHMKKKKYKTQDDVVIPRNNLQVLVFILFNKTLIKLFIQTGPISMI